MLAFVFHLSFVIFRFVPSMYWKDGVKYVCFWIMMQLLSSNHLEEDLICILQLSWQFLSILPQKLWLAYYGFLQGISLSNQDILIFGFFRTTLLINLRGIWWRILRVEIITALWVVSSKIMMRFFRSSRYSNKRNNVNLFRSRFSNS